MTQEEKAVARLLESDIDAKEENGTVYICIEDSQFEIADYEIEFQANLYDETREEE